MSRIGRMPITVPEDVKVNIEDQKIIINGPKATTNIGLHSEIGVKLDDKKFILSAKSQTKTVSSILGTTRTLIQNAIEGVSKGFEKKLEIHGVGYKASKKGEDLVIEIGFANPVTINAPKGIELQVQKNQIIVSGADKKQVGEVAAMIRNIRKVEPYKGKGIRYVDEVVKKKVGKKAKAAIGEGAATGAA